MNKQAAYQNHNLARYVYDLLKESDPIAVKGLEEVGGTPSWAGVTDLKAPGGEIMTATRSTGANGEIAFTKRQSVVKGLLVAQLGGSDVAGEASQMNATVREGKSRFRVSEIKFNQDVGDSMTSALNEVQKYMTVRHDGFPKGSEIEISFEEQYSSKDGPSAAVACGLLLDTLITGEELDKNFAVTGDMNADGSVQKVGGIDGKIRGATKRNCTHVGIPAQNAKELPDLLVTEELATLAGIQIFSLPTFDSALKLAKAPESRDPEVNEALEIFKEVQTVLQRPGGLSYVGNSHVKEKLKQVLEKTPNHESAKLLLMKGEGRTPRYLTLRGSFSQIDRVTKPIFTVLETGDIDASVDGLRDSISDLRKLRTVLDPRAKDCADSLEDLSTYFTEYSNTNPTRGSPRYKDIFGKINEAIGRIRTSYNNIASDPEIQEELIE